MSGGEPERWRSRSPDWFEWLLFSALILFVLLLINGEIF